MQLSKHQLINDLLSTLENAIAQAQKFKQLSTEELNFRKTPTSWSVLECIEHLNLYGDFYIPEIEKQLLASKGNKNDNWFKPGLIGNYFVKMMQQNNGKVKKMKTFKDKDPIHQPISATAIERFIKQCLALKTLLHQAKSVNLTKTKTAITISSFIKLRMGDTLRFVIVHIERHMAQADEVIKQYNREHRSFRVA